MYNNSANFNESEYRFNATDGESEYSLLNDDQRLAVILYFTYGLLAVTGNTVLLAAMYKSSLLQYGGFLTLFHNAWTDVAVGCINLFYTPWTVLKFGALPAQIDRGYAIGFVLVYGLFARKMFMTFMALTKFCSIMFPLLARRVMTLEWYRKALISMWVIACLFCLAPWIKKCAYFDTTKLMWSVGPREHQFYFVYWATVNSLVTTVFLATYPVCFCKLIRNERYWKHRTVTDSDGKTVTAPASCFPQIVSFRERNLLYIFALDATIYMLFTVPVYLFELLHVPIAHYGMYKETLRGILTGYTPVMYSLLNRNIRNAIFELISSPFRSQQSKLFRPSFSV